MEGKAVLLSIFPADNPGNCIECGGKMSKYLLKVSGDISHERFHWICPKHPTGKIELTFSYFGSGTQNVSCDLTFIE